jgi:hypothetical protein
MVLPFCGNRPREPPKRLWIRASELPLRSLVWALENGVLDSDGADNHQMTLATWVELPALETPRNPPELSLPGPPSDPYGFFEKSG